MVEKEHDVDYADPEENKGESALKVLIYSLLLLLSLSSHLF